MVRKSSHVLLHKQYATVSLKWLQSIYCIIINGLYICLSIKGMLNVSFSLFEMMGNLFTGQGIGDIKGTTV